MILLRRATAPATLVLACSLVAAALLGGCGYFRPATPEAPSNGDQIIPDYTTVEGTLESIRQAVEAKGLRAGDAAYRGAFADSTSPTTTACHFFFSAEDAATWAAQSQTLPSDWTLRDEGPFFNVADRSLVNLRDDPYSMTWAEEPSKPDDNGNGVSTIHRRYTIYAIGADGTVAEIIAKGYADLVLILDSHNNWIITRWTDRVDPEGDTLAQKTWGLRRLEY